MGLVGRVGVSFSTEDLRRNFDALVNALVNAIVKAKPAGAKGKYLQKAALSSSMGALA